MTHALRITAPTNHGAPSQSRATTIIMISMGTVIQTASDLPVPSVRVRGAQRVEKFGIAVVAGN